MKTNGIVLAVGLFALVATAHCGSRYSKYCDNERNCAGGNDKDVDACVEQHRAFENVSSAYDCDDSWDKYATCLETATCQNKHMTTSACQTQAVAWGTCVQGASGKTKEIVNSETTNSNDGGN
jgi:hypothetical protein